ncbi:unnamed protein product [Zymoseptoria tritici ST99CH_3D1]|nr:unnamed protein product [Zymoseptoria tritici ST99CH_3D1]
MHDQSTVPSKRQRTSQERQSMARPADLFAFPLHDSGDFFSRRTKRGSLQSLDTLSKPSTQNDVSPLDVPSALPVMEDEDQLIDDLLEKSRLISIFIGGSHNALQVQQQVLENLSPYFSNALKVDRFKEGRDGVMRFPEDEMDVWKTLLQWVFCRKLPKSLNTRNGKLTEDDLHLAVRCWTTGDKYGIKDFQDTIMLRILRHLDKLPLFKMIGVHIVLIAFERTPPGSLLRNLFTDFIVMAVYRIEPMADPDDRRIQPSDHVLASLEVLDGTGFFPAMTAKKTQFDKMGTAAFDWRYNPSSTDDDPDWKDFFLAYDGFNCVCPQEHE